MAGLRLKPKMTIGMLILLLVPIAVVTLVLVRINLFHLATQARKYRMSVSENVLTAISSAVAEARTEMETLGATLRQPLELETLLKRAKSQLKGARLTHMVGIYTPAGNRAQTLRAKEAKHVLAPPDKLDETVRGIARTEEACYLGVRWSKTGSPFLPVVTGVHQIGGKTIKFYLYSAVSLAPFSKELRNLSHRRFDGQRDNIYIVDSLYRIIAHGDPKRVGKIDKTIAAEKYLFKQNASYSLHIERGGEVYLTAVTSIKTLGWGIVVQQRERDAYRAIEKTWLTGLGAGAGLAFVALILGLIFGGRFARPVLEVAKAAAQVANGNFDTRVTVSSGDEIGQMAGAFNQMASDLQTYHDKVIEETRIRTDLSRYLGPDVVEQIVQSKQGLKLGGERREVTIMFADVVAFTPLAERVNPERIVGILNELFTFVTEIIYKQGGIIDKFIGDCVMAVFGTPVQHDDDPARCVRAAEQIMEWLEVGNAKWKQELGAELQLAIGINTGEVIAGNIGSEKRMEYTVIGDAVNIAARLESMARPGQILLSKATWSLLDPKEFDAENLGSFNLVGRTTQTEAFSLEIE